MLPRVELRGMMLAQCILSLPDSSVFTNRLKINMGLQYCATLEYIITEIKNKKHPKRLFYEDLEIEYFGLNF